MYVLIYLLPGFISNIESGAFKSPIVIVELSISPFDHKFRMISSQYFNYICKDLKRSHSQVPGAFVGGPPFRPPQGDPELNTQARRTLPAAEPWEGTAAPLLALWCLSAPPTRALGTRGPEPSLPCLPGPWLSPAGRCGLRMVPFNSPGCGAGTPGNACALPLPPPPVGRGRGRGRVWQELHQALIDALLSPRGQLRG